MTATLSRRQFVKTGGVLFVGFGLVGRNVFDASAAAAGSRNSLDAALASSWFEIHADNTILMRTGKVDFGQSTVLRPWWSRYHDEQPPVFHTLRASLCWMCSL